jgi:type I restriction enzyme S subunit
MKMSNNGWQVKSLGEVVRISKGKKLNSLVDGKTTNAERFIQIDDLRNNEMLKYTEDKSGVIVNENDVLIAWDGANAGTVGFGLNGFIGSTIARLELLDENIFTNYFGWYLRTKTKYLRDNCTGATIPHINKSVLESLKIPLPPLPIQKQIAVILEKADEAKQKRKEANKLTDEFLQSVFIEMFGDPVKNPKGWQIQKFGELGKLARGKSKHRPRNAPFLLGGPYPLIQTGEIVNSSIYIKNYTQTYSEEGLKQSKIWPKGTLCISIAANIGYTAIVNFDACFPDSIVGFIPYEKVIAEYIHFYFSFIQSQLEEYAPQSAQKNINLGILDSLKIPVPPISLQQQFAEIVNKTEALKEKQKQSEQELENLFQSLMQKAFKGELV